MYRSEAANYGGQIYTLMTQILLLVCGVIKESLELILHL